MPRVLSSVCPLLSFHIFPSSWYYYFIHNSYILSEFLRRSRALCSAIYFPLNHRSPHYHPSNCKHIDPNVKREREPGVNLKFIRESLSFLHTRVRTKKKRNFIYDFWKLSHKKIFFSKARSSFFIRCLYRNERYMFLNFQCIVIISFSLSHTHTASWKSFITVLTTQLVK